MALHNFVLISVTWE